MASIEAHRAAIVRGDLSRPVRLALDTGVLTGADSFFDYGCGHGEDVVGLRKAGYEAAGWDPYFQPNEPRRHADIVNLGYVINCITDPAERATALRNAWRLASRALIVSARLNNERRNISAGRPHSDGYVTGNGTFQRFYSQSELRAWLDDVLGVESVAAAPGIFIAFRAEEHANAFLIRTRRRRAVHVTISRFDRLYNEHRDVLAPLIDFYTERGRLPRNEEAPDIVDPIRARLRGLKRAWSIITGAVGEDVDWEDIARARRDDLLVELALLKLNRRPNLGKLPASTRHDIKAFFGSYKDATAAADELLFSAGDLDLISHLADKAEIGKRLPSAHYVHATALPSLPGAMRVYEGCARWLVGDVADANIIKVATDKPKVSYLSYPDFDTAPHPALARATYVRLRTLGVDVRDYTASDNPPILHRKETFVANDHPLRDKFARLTAQEARFGLFDEDSRLIGNRNGWNERLRKAGVELRGHRVVRT